MIQGSSRSVLVVPVVLMLGMAGVAEAESQRLSLWNGRAPVSPTAFEDADAILTVYTVSATNATAVVVCPGGGYGGLVSGPEGHGIARWLNQHGIAGAVLEYRLPRGRSEVPMMDARRAIQTLRERAAEFGVNPHAIGIMGFSAGGHLAGSAAVHGRGVSRPDFAVLIYPVISMGPVGHAGSRKNLLGPTPSDDLVKRFSLEDQVTPDTPPVYLAHAADDRVVPPENSRGFYRALQEKRLPGRYLELPTGGHGLNGYKGPSWDAWQEGVLVWFGEMGVGLE